MRWHMLTTILLCPARPRSKNKNARRSAIYPRFCVSLAWRCVILRLCGGPAASNQGRKPAQPEQLSPDSGHNRPQRGQNPGRSYARVCVCRARRARGKQPRPETSVARAAIPESGHDRQSPARPKPWYKRKIARRSPIYARVCVCRARRARGKQPRPETSVAGAAIPDSGHDRQSPARPKAR